MTGGLVVDDRPPSTGSAPGRVHRRRVGPLPRPLRPRRQLALHDPRRFGRVPSPRRGAPSAPTPLEVTPAERARALASGRPRRGAAPEGPPARPAPPGRCGQPARRRDPLAGRALPAHPLGVAGRVRGAAAPPATCGPPCDELAERGGSHTGDLIERAAARRTLPRATAPSWSLAPTGSAAAPPGGARPTSDKGGGKGRGPWRPISEVLRPKAPRAPWRRGRRPARCTRPAETYALGVDEERRADGAEPSSFPYMVFSSQAP